MSIARIHTVQHARQRFEKVAKTDDEGKQVVTAVKSKYTGEQKLSRRGRPISRRIRVSDKSKPLDLLKCGKCRDEIQIGAPYRWFVVGFRGYKQYRCMKSSCTPRMSELESSKLSGVYAAQEDAIDNLNAMDSISVEESDVAEELQTAADTIREIADEYREAAEAMGDAGSENEERADNLESAIDELEGWSTSGDSDPEPCEEHEDETSPKEDCEACGEKRSEWGQALIDEGIETVDGLSI